MITYFNNNLAKPPPQQYYLQQRLLFQSNDTVFKNNQIRAIEDLTFSALSSAMALFCFLVDFDLPFPFEACFIYKLWLLLI